MRKIKGKNNGTLNLLEKGETANPNGRPKKFVSTLKSQGYKLSEINDCIKVMLSMNEEQLEAVKENKTATALERMIASAINASIKKGDLSTMETLVSRTFGKPKETIEITTPPEVEAARAMYERRIESGLPKKKALAETLQAAKGYGVELSENDILDADTIE